MANLKRRDSQQLCVPTACIEQLRRRRCAFKSFILSRAVSMAPALEPHSKGDLRLRFYHLIKLHQRETWHAFAPLPHTAGMSGIEPQPPPLPCHVATAHPSALAASAFRTHLLFMRKVELQTRFSKSRSTNQSAPPHFLVRLGSQTASRLLFKVREAASALSHSARATNMRKRQSKLLLCTSVFLRKSLACSEGRSMKQSLSLSTFQSRAT